MFLLVPFVIWMFDTSVTSGGQSTSASIAFLPAGIGPMPGWFLKLVVLALIWAYLHHLIAGVRHLWMDVDAQRVSKGRPKLGDRHAALLRADHRAGARLFGCSEAQHGHQLRHPDGFASSSVRCATTCGTG